jgi:acylphosphatase
MAVARQVFYSGKVQGVGFRYTAQRIAGGFAVSGYVRNLRDGRVELLAEGEPDQVDAFLAAVARAMAGGIARAEVQEVAGQGFRGFAIRYD